ncbi:MAG TPA: amylo-alpha-1,6-glucosidase, partial [Terriglobales bacterium]|nr:amylo-alpha-1,6-glucosidase [Terriglobales bacterium]
VEGGPLLPVKTEFYQSGLGLEALRSLASLASLVGKNDVSKELQAAFERQKPAFNQTFWSPEKKAYVYALDQQNRRMDELSVLTTVPMWFGLTDPDKSEATIQQLAEADHQTDWGMRIISNRSALYNGSGYHFGSVWPLFTGWASVGEYRYHEAFPAYANLRANALLALDGSLGHVAEVLSGDYYQPLSTNSPHQIWSAAMVVSPILRGLLGIETDAQNHTLVFAPHVPAEWRSFSVDNLRVGSAVVSVGYRKTPGLITVEVRRTGAGDCMVVFSPALSLRSGVASVELNGHGLPFHVSTTSDDQHVTIRFPATDVANIARIHLKNDFGLGFSGTLPPLGSVSEGLRILSESWNAGHTQLSLTLSGLAGKGYDLSVWNPLQIASVQGGQLHDARQDEGKLTVEFPAANAGSYVRQELVINFAK